MELRGRARTAIGLVVLAAVLVAVLVAALLTSEVGTTSAGQAPASSGHHPLPPSRMQRLAASGHHVHIAGRIVPIVVHAHVAPDTERTIVWLPPQYFAAGFAHYRFPVVEFLPGQPNWVYNDLGNFKMVPRALAQIRRTGKPFVLVMPPLMIRRPVDTECTDVPHGPRALSWLTDDVPRAVESRFRVARQGRHWSMFGWSTGAFCAAKIILMRPRQYSAAIAMGGYFRPITWGSWPHLFGGSLRVRHLNSPEWLYEHRGGMRGDLLHLIGSTGDPEVLKADRQMMRVAHGDPRVTSSTFVGGRHRQPSYWQEVPAMLRWLGDHGAMG